MGGEKKPLVMSELGCADGCGREMGAENCADGCGRRGCNGVAGFHLHIPHKLISGQMPLAILAQCCYIVAACHAHRTLFIMQMQYRCFHSVTCQQKQY